MSSNIVFMYLFLYIFAVNIPLHSYIKRRPTTPKILSLPIGWPEHPPPSMPVHILTSLRATDTYKTIRPYIFMYLRGCTRGFIDKEELHITFNERAQEFLLSGDLKETDEFYRQRLVNISVLAVRQLKSSKDRWFASLNVIVAERQKNCVGLC